MTEPERVVRLIEERVKQGMAGGLTREQAENAVSISVSELRAALAESPSESRDGLREELRAIHALIVKGLGEDTDLEWELTEARDRLAALAESPRESRDGLREALVGLLLAADNFGDPFKTGTGTALDAARKKARAALSESPEDRDGLSGTADSNTETVRSDSGTTNPKSSGGPAESIDEQPLSETTSILHEEGRPLSDDRIDFGERLLRWLRVYPSSPRPEQECTCEYTQNFLSRRNPNCPVPGHGRPER